MDAESHGPAPVKSEAKATNGPRSPYYFLSLEVENVRCFKDAQTLILSGSQGRPKRWTVLLGDNGVGKTTLLQVLASFQSKQVTVGTSGRLMSLPRVFEESQDSRARFLRAGQRVWGAGVTSVTVLNWPRLSRP
jgi:ABC-type molybdenum transport system ATPase subunit/photorepair protein PhrA